MVTRRRVAERSADLRRADSRRTVVRRAVGRFGVGVVLALLVLGLGTTLMSHRIASDEAIRDAQATASAITRQLVGPQLDLGDPTTTASDSTLVRLLDHRMLDGSVTHLKVWNSDGQLLWSDEPELVGRRFVLPRAVRQLFGTSSSVAELADDEKPVAGGEPSEGDLLEVYVGGFDAGGRPFVLETYTSRQRLAHSTQTIFLDLLPIGLAALLLFAAVTLPLAVSLARHVDRAQEARTEMLRHSLEAWARERRRLAQRLHDGVVQDMAAVGYTLHWVLDELPPSAATAREAGTRATGLLERGTTSLRDVVGDLLVPEVEDGDLASALRDLADGAEDRGLQVRLDVDPRAAWDREVAGIVFSVVREAIVNVLKHAQARVATVTVRAEADRVDVRVADDGRGPGAPASDTDKHVGLELLARSIDEVGGEMAVSPGQGGGFVLTASLPSHLDP